MSAPSSAFTTRSALLLIVVGAALFVALLWMIGTGFDFDNSNDGGSHAGGKGLNGFAGLVRLATADGWDATLARDDAALNQPGLLVLTPAADASGADIARIVSRHRRIGPVLVITPKWLVEPLPHDVPGARRGWVALTGIQPPQWRGFLDRVNVSLLTTTPGTALRWRATALTGPLPDARATQVGGGADDRGLPLIPLVRIAGGPHPGQNPVLAAYVAAVRSAPAIDRLALDGPPPTGTGTASPGYPLVLVFEPDLFDNYGMADPANAALASRLLAAVAPPGPRAVQFDLTLNGLGHAPNLLTLAFTPPWLAATLCLIMAALAAGWRSFCRFGAARIVPRDMALGKTRLVANAGSLILRARRLHLLGPPYAAACRARLVRALSLPHHADSAATDAAIDRALAARRAAQLPASAQPGPTFAETVDALHRARNEPALIEAARALALIERNLIR